MLIKCKTKGSRVKGVVFHPRLHFLLASMHSGEIQMWDYLNSSLVEVFTEHEGPVRGIDFHLEQPLFASGGDDTTVIVWDFTLRRMLFKLDGHLDYVRTVQFHTKYPWLMSASDDQTIRIWNWQSRSCLSVISGHNHYVMSAMFHPTENLIISASLDHTARIWDMTYLVEKKCSLKPPNHQAQAMYAYENAATTTFEIDIAGVADVLCLHTMTGHASGVNYAIFFGTNLAITAGDDCSIRIWRYTEFSFYQTNILREHEDNVTCLLLVKDYLLSTSEDHSIRIWDLNTYGLVHTYLMDEDRFWAISKSRHSNYITAGHDSGLIVFKLYKERPLMALNSGRDRNMFYYAWNNNVYVNNLENECNAYYKELLQSGNVNAQGGKKELDLNLLYYKWLETHSANNLVPNVEDTDTKLVFQCPSGPYLGQRKMIATVTDEKKKVMPHRVLVNHHVRDRVVLMLIYNNGKSGFLELFSYNRGFLEYSFKRSCHTAAFANEHSLVVVDKTLLVYNLKGDIVSELSLAGQTTAADLDPFGPVQHTTQASPAKERDLSTLKVFNAAPNMLLFYYQKTQTLYLYSLPERGAVNTVNAPYGKLYDVIVNPYGFICCVFNNFVVIYDAKMNRLAYKQQFNRIKSAAWHNNTSVIYTTYNQVHYLLLNGSFGIMCTMVCPTYLIKVVDTADGKQVLYLINRQHRCFKHVVDSPDYSLKHSLLVNDLERANTLVNSGQMFGRFTCSYLINDRKYELARKLLNDDHATKFYLSIQFGNLQNALNDAKLINKKRVWSYLGDVALELGNITIAEMSYQKSKQYNKLSLLYLITGDFGKLRKMLNICKIHNNKSLALVHALYLGDMEELSSLMLEGGNADLAKVCNSTYHINDYDSTRSYNANAKYLLPPKPVNKFEGEMLNWSVSFIDSKEAKFNIEDIQQFTKTEAPPDQREEDMLRTASLDLMQSQMSNLSVSRPSDYVVVQLPQTQVLETAGFKLIVVNDEGPDLFGEILQDTGESPLSAELKEQPPQSDGSEDIWDSLNAAPPAVPNEQKLFELLKKKDYTTALNLIISIYGEVNVEMMKGALTSVDLSVYSGVDQINLMPLMNDRFSAFMNHFHNAEFDACAETLRALMPELFLYKTLSVNVREWMLIAYWYALAMRLELERAKCSETDPKRSLELAAYLTCCPLNPRQLYLVLRKVIGLMWKAKNYQTAAALVTRLLQLDTSQVEVDQAEIEKAKKIHTLCLQKGSDSYQLDFQPEDLKELYICTVSFVKLRDEATVTCLFCGSVALRKYLSQPCPTCGLLKLV